MSTQRGRGNPNWRGGRPSATWNTGKGGFAPRGVRGGYRKRNAQPQPDLVKHPLGELLATITNADLAEKNGKSDLSTISGCQFVASYNWMNRATPTILTPGNERRSTSISYELIHQENHLYGRP